VCLLQVIADELLVLAGPPARLDLDAAGQLLVQLHPIRLRDPAVRRVADQDVREPEGVVRAAPRLLGPDQLLAHQ
jgi:hypothetical protein